MVRYMVDSVDCNNYTSSALVPGRGVQPISLTCGYVGGSYEKSSHKCGPVDVDIDVNGNHPNADVLDIEVGDATPDTAPGWVKVHNANRPDYPAILYCNRSTRNAVAKACAASGLQAGRDYRWWISTLDGTTSLPDMTGVIAVQAWGSNYFNRNIDLSIVLDDTWKSTKEIDMLLSDPISFTRPDTQKVVTYTVSEALAWTNWYAGQAAAQTAILQGQISGLLDALHQLTSGAIDLKAVADAAQAGAAKALAAIDIAITPKQI